MTLHTFRHAVGFALAVGLLCLMYAIYGESIR